MEKNLSFSESTATRVRAKLTWAQFEIVSSHAAQVDVFIAGDDESVEELRVEQSENGLVIAQPQLAYAKEILPRRHWLQICLRLPQEFSGSLDVDTVSGAVGAHGVAGAGVSIATVSGQINARDVRADHLRLRTVSGALVGADLAADRGSMRTVSGAVKANGVSMRTAKVFTVSGEVALALSSAGESLDMQSVSGMLYVETDGPVRASLHSLSGQFLLDDDLLPGRGTAQEQPLIMKITASSVSGDLTVRRNKPDANTE